VLHSLNPFNHLTHLTDIDARQMQAAQSCHPSSATHHFLRVRLGLTETRNPVAVFPLTAFLEQFRALKTLEHISFAAQRGSRAQTSML